MRICECPEQGRRQHTPAPVNVSQTGSLHVWPKTGNKQLKIHQICRRRRPPKGPSDATSRPPGRLRPSHALRRPIGRRALRSATHATRRPPKSSAKARTANTSGRWVGEVPLASRLLAPEGRLWPEAIPMAPQPRHATADHSMFARADSRTPGLRFLQGATRRPINKLRPAKAPTAQASTTINREACPWLGCLALHANCYALAGQGQTLKGPRRIDDPSEIKADKVQWLRGPP